MGGVRIRRGALCLLGLAAMSLAAASSGWACASVTSLDFTPAVAAPGQEVTVLVTFVSKDKPVELRWDALNGPLLTTIDVSTLTEGLHGNWRFATGKITIPTDAKPGNHLVIATQDYVRGTATWGMPARGLIQVSGAGSPVVGSQPGAPPEVRPVDLVADEGVGAGTILVAALGAAGVTMLVGGIGILFLSFRKGRAPAAAAAEVGR